MKLRVNLHGLIIEYERRPMPEGRFRALCVLAAAGLYAGTVVSIASLCGFFGVILLLVCTVFVGMMADLK